MESAAQRLLAFAESEYGDSVRAVVYGDRENQSFLYHREDVLDRYDRDITEHVLRDLFFESFDAERVQDLYRVSPLDATVRVFGELIVFSFAYGDDHGGMLLSLDADADPPIVSFVSDCRDRIRGNAE